MKKISVTIALLSALMVAGCAQTIKTLSDPSFTQAVNNSKNLATAITCGFVVPGAALSTEILSTVNAGKTAIDTSGKVSAISQAICVSLSRLPDIQPIPQVGTTVVTTPAVTLPAVSVTTPSITVTAPVSTTTTTVVK